MFSNVIQILRTSSGSIFMMFGFLGVLFGIVGIIDPVGSKMADDNDPFGVPPTFVENFILICIYGLVLLLGIWLVFCSKWVKELLNKLASK